MKILYLPERYAGYICIPLRFMIKSVKYRDIPFMPLLIAFISAFNYYLTYDHIRFNSYLLLTYSLDTLQGLMAWWTVRAIIIYLDRKMPYGLKPLKRIVLQLLMTSLAGLLVIILTTELISLIFRGHTAPLNFYFFDLFVIGIWFFVLNGIYIGMHYYYEWKLAEQKNKESGKQDAGGVFIRQGKQDLLIPHNEIAGFFAEQGYTILVHTNGKKYYLELSLDKMEKQVPGQYFFRINRQCLLHREQVIGFKRLNDGKLEIMIRPSESLAPVLQMSRLRAPAFKSWFQTG
jgi:LytTr DNA-binding domain